MYIWTAVDVNKQVYELRKKAEIYAKQQELLSSTFSLPFHIPLKIFFEIPNERFDEVVKDIHNFYKTLNPFEIVIKGIEHTGSIVWMTMKKNVELINIHEKLDEMLLQKYGIMQYAFDKDFKFHTSIFITANSEKAAKAFASIKDAYLPKSLKAERFIIGSSETGTAGTYQVLEKIEI